MLNLFSKKGKTPQEVVQEASAALRQLKSSPPAGTEKAGEEASKQIGAMKVLLFGDTENDPSPELAGQLANELCHSDVLPLMVANIGCVFFDFDTRKDIAQIFNAVIKRQTGTRLPTVEYLMSTKHTVFHDLIVGYENKDVALNCGLMLRECVKNQDLAHLVIHSDEFFLLFNFVEMPNFDAAADAFSTLKDLLTRHKPMVAEFLEANYDRVFEQYTKLLHSDNYVTRRQSLKVLGEMLLDRSNFKTMTRYISSPDNLKLMMNLLRDKFKSIQFEAFHVFKVFVANPQKAAAIVDILFKNKEKLVQYLQQFQNDKEDEQFNEEKALLIKEISGLAAPTAA